MTLSPALSPLHYKYKLSWKEVGGEMHPLLHQGLQSFPGNYPILFIPLTMNGNLVTTEVTSLYTKIPHMPGLSDLEQFRNAPS